MLLDSLVHRLDKGSSQPSKYWIGKLRLDKSQAHFKILVQVRFIIFSTLLGVVKNCLVAFSKYSFKICHRTKKQYCFLKMNTGNFGKHKLIIVKEQRICKNISLNTNFENTFVSKFLYQLYFRQFKNSCSQKQEPNQSYESFS